MNLRFDNPNLLWLGALALLPVLIHLFARAHPPVFRFSSVDFLLQVVRRNARIKRPREWLLMLLRLLGLGLLAAAFARPVLHFTSRPGRKRTSLVAIIDATASMRCLDGAQTRFAQACAKASDLLARLRPGDLAAVVWLRRRPRSVFPTLAVNLDYLQRAVRRARCSFEDGDIAAALDLGRSLLADAPGNRRLCIISDFQKSAWEHADLAVPRSIELLTLPVGRRQCPNLAVTRVRCRPARPVRGTVARVGCELRNFSPASRTVAVHCAIGGTLRREARVRLAAWGSGGAAFSWPVQTAGPQVIRVSVDAPGDFSPDNQRCLQVTAAPALRVGLVRRGPDTPYWRRVLAVLPGVRVIPVDAMDQATGLDALVIPGARPAELTAARHLAESGLTVIWAPAAGDRTRPGSPVGLQVLAPDSPALRLLAKNGPAAFQAVRFRNYGAVPAGIGSGEKLLAYPGGVPALAHRRMGAGHWLLWNMPLAPAAGDLLRFPELLVPLAGECLAGYRGGRGEAGPSILPGTRVRIPPQFREKGPGVSLVDAAGKRVVAAASENAVPRWSPPLARPGVYAWQVGGKPAGYVVVNFPSIESDLRRLPAPPAPDRARVIRGGRDFRRLQEGVPLWPRLYAAALVVFAAELGLMVFSRRPAPAVVEGGAP